MPSAWPIQFDSSKQLRRSHIGAAHYYPSYTSTLLVPIIRIRGRRDTSDKRLERRQQLYEDVKTARMWVDGNTNMIVPTHEQPLVTEENQRKSVQDTRYNERLRCDG